MTLIQAVEQAQYTKAAVNRGRRHRYEWLLALCMLLFLYGCSSQPIVNTAQELTGGSTMAGQHLIYAYGCGACHTIPGIAEANGTVGPTLERFASRVYIAGSLANEPENLVHWLAKPQEIVPGNAMPDLGITDRQARDMAAYLYMLR